MEDRLIGLEQTRFAIKMRMIQHNLTRIVGDDTVFGLDDRGIFTVESEVNLRR